MEDKEIIIFDLDGTLTPSKSALEPDMAQLLVQLLERKKVVVASGGSFSQFEEQFLNYLPSSHKNFDNLILVPNSGTRMEIWQNAEGRWREEYSELLSLDQRQKIIDAINSAIAEAGENDPDIVYGPPIIQDRGSEVTFSALGQETPLPVKLRWDPDRKKREKVLQILKDKIPEFSVRIGGATSIDITRHGVDKRYAIKKINEYFKIPIEKMLFVGDALFPGGNDYPAKEAGVECISVTGPEETKNLIRKWLTN